MKHIDDDDGYRKLDIDALAEDGYNLYVEWARKLLDGTDKTMLVQNILTYAVAAQYMIEYATKVQEALIKAGHVKLVPRIDESELN